MTNTLRAIETTYAGVRFRSRLEARWAVFFDEMSIAWRYEDEGYELSFRRYLPDFVLPECGTHIEVRGDAARVDLNELAAIADELPDLPPAPGCEAGPKLLLLGPIPDCVLVDGDFGWIGSNGPSPNEDDCPTWYPYGFGAFRKNHRPWSLGCGYNSNDPLRPSVDEYEDDSAQPAYNVARRYRFWDPS